MKKWCLIILVVLLVSSGSLSAETFASKVTGDSDLLKVEIYRDKCGFIDKTGKLVIDGTVTFAGDFHEGMVRVGNWDKQIDNTISWGYMDKTGKYIIPPTYKQKTEGYSEESIPVGNFSEGLAAVSFDGNKPGSFGYIDKTGKIVIQPQFDKAYDFQNGIAAVYIQNKYGFINKNGKYVIKPQFSEKTYHTHGFIFKYKYEFNEGLCAFTGKYEGKSKDKGNKNATAWGVVDRNGKVIVKPEYNFIGDFQNGIAPAESWGTTSYFYLIDKTGKILKKINLPLSPDKKTQIFSEGIACRCNYITGYYIDTEGKILNKCAPKYNPSNFKEGFSRFHILVPNADDKYGFFDRNFKIAINNLEGAYDFSEGLAYVKVKGKCGFIDKTGKMMITLPAYNDFTFNLMDDPGYYSFKNGIAKVRIKKGESYYESYIDKKGKIIYDPEMVPGRTLKGTLTLPEGDVAPKGGLIVKVQAYTDDGSQSRDGYFIIPEGKSSIFYNFTIPQAPAGYYVTYSVENNIAYRSDLYYGTGGMVSETEKIILVDPSKDSITNIDIQKQEKMK